MKHHIALVFLSFTFLNALSQNRVIDSLEAVLRNSNNEVEKTVTRTVLSLKYYNAGEAGKARDMMARAEKDLVTLKSDRAGAEVYNTKGIFYYYESKFDSALMCFEKALPLKEKTGDKEGQLRTMNNMAGIHYMQMDYKNALALYEKGFTREAEFGIAEGSIMSLTDLGSLYYALNMYPRAVKYYKKAEKVVLSTGKKAHLPYTFDGLSNVYRDMKKFDSSIYYAKKSMQISVELNDKPSVAYSAINTGLIYQAMKQYDTAATYLRRSLALAKDLTDKRLELAVYANFAALFVEKKETDSALKYIELLIPLQKELNYKKNEEDLAKIFSQYYYNKKDYKTAYDYIMIYDRKRDSIYSLETTGQLTEMQEKYETQKKEKENQLLQSENTTHKKTRNYLLVILGIAFISIVGGLFAYNKIRKSSRIISKQKELVEEQHKEITDSINYAQRIQRSLLASEDLLKKNLGEHFVFFKPKDVVSGDFYWAAPLDDTKFALVTADSTGHGVPGAIMSMLNIACLNEAVQGKKLQEPAEILNQTRSSIIRQLANDGSAEGGKDGMDCSLMIFDFKNKILKYAAANNPIWIVRNKELIELSPDKMPVGKHDKDSVSFKQNSFQLLTGDMVYGLTDGFADQFGGSKGKKFMYKKLKDLLVNISQLDVAAQKAALEKNLREWMQNQEQVDDVTVIGIRI